MAARKPPPSPHPDRPPVLQPGDARLPTARGRGAQVNPTNRFEKFSLEVLPDFAEEVATESPDGSQVRTRVYRDRTREVINRVVPSPDISFEWTINPYRGCEHGCTYCYARPYHEYIGFSSGLDFETRIVAKLDAPELLPRELDRPSWRGEPIVMSGVTDPYQPVEAKLEITRRVLEICARRGQAVSIITKGRLVVRDVDLLSRLASTGSARAFVSITTLDPKLARAMEPRASSPAHRLEAVRALAEAGVPVGVMVAPLIPGLNDREAPAILAAAHEAGARHAGYTLVRLPHGVKEVFVDWLRREFPDRAAHVESLIRQTREGKLNSTDFSARMGGAGPIADQIGGLFRVSRARLGMDGKLPELKSAARGESAAGGQGVLF